MTTSNDTNALRAGSLKAASRRSSSWQVILVCLYPEVTSSWGSQRLHGFAALSL